MYQVLLQYLAILMFIFSIIYSIILVALVALRLCTKNQKIKLLKSIQNHYTQQKNHNTNPIFRISNKHNTLSKKRRLMLLFYVGFKVFYNFIFTLSVCLSLILSLESNMAPFEIVPSEIIYTTADEVKRIDNYIHDELKRQNEFSRNMIQACVNKRFKCRKNILYNILNCFNKSIINNNISNEIKELNHQKIFSEIYGLISDSFINGINRYKNYSINKIDGEFKRFLNDYMDYIYQYQKLYYLNTAKLYYRFPIIKLMDNKSYFMKQFNNLQITKRKYKPLSILYEIISQQKSEKVLIERLKSMNLSTSVVVRHQLPYPEPIQNKLDTKKTLIQTDTRHFHTITESSIINKSNNNNNQNRQIIKTNSFKKNIYDLPEQFRKYVDENIRKEEGRIIHKVRPQFQLRITIWQVRLLIVLLDLLIITHRFYCTLCTIRVIWFGTHIYMAVQNTTQIHTQSTQLRNLTNQQSPCRTSTTPQHHTNTNPTTTTTFIRVNLDKYIRHLRPPSLASSISSNSIENASSPSRHINNNNNTNINTYSLNNDNSTSTRFTLESTMSKMFPCFQLCSRLSFITVIITCSLLVGFIALLETGAQITITTELLQKHSMKSILNNQFNNQYRLFGDLLFGNTKSWLMKKQKLKETRLIWSLNKAGLKYMSLKANDIINRLNDKLNNKRLKDAVIRDKYDREQLIWLRSFLKYHKKQSNEYSQHFLCQLSKVENILPFISSSSKSTTLLSSSSSSIYQPLQKYCTNQKTSSFQYSNKNDQSQRSTNKNSSIYSSPIVDCSLQPCYFVKIKSLNYSIEHFINKHDKYLSGPPIGTSVPTKLQLLLPIVRLLIVTTLVSIAIGLMIGTIRHASKLLSQLCLTYTPPITATLLNRHYPILTRASQQRHTHSYTTTTPPPTTTPTTTGIITNKNSNNRNIQGLKLHIPTQLPTQQQQHNYIDNRLLQSTATSYSLLSHDLAMVSLSNNNNNTILTLPFTVLSTNSSNITTDLTNSESRV